MHKLLIFFFFLFINNKCFKLRNWKKLHKPFYLNQLIKKHIPLHKGNKITYTFLSLKNNTREENESNIFDESYVYHKPVLLNEVIQYISKNESYNQINRTTINPEKVDLNLSSKFSNKNVTNINKSENFFKNEKKNPLYEHKELLTCIDINNLKNNNLTKKFNIDEKMGKKNDEEEINYYIDATLGGGGHTLEILKKIKSSKVIAIDKDIESIYYNKFKLKEFIDKNQLVLIHGDYRNILHLLNYHSIPLSNYSGMLVDLGVSLHQLKSSKRGFSYKYDGILDMDMNKYSESEFTNIYFSNDNCNTNSNYGSNNINSKIHNILNTYSLKKLKFIIEKFGEEKKALKIAKKILQWRKTYGKIKTTYDLKHIILSTCKQNYKSNNKVLSRVFQAFRIYINDELNALKELLVSAHKILKPRGRLITISYHSLENKCIDKVIEKGKGLWTKVNKNAIIPSENEIKLNNSSRSAKMHVFEKK